MQTYLTFQDVLESVMKGKQQTDNPEVIEGVSLADVRGMATGELVEAGTEPDLPKDASLPKVSVLGVEFTQAAERYAKDSGRFETAKIPLDKMKEVIVQIGKVGMEKGLPEEVIMNDIQSYMNRFGYTEDMLHPESVRVKDIDDRYRYFTNRPNPLPALKLTSDLSGSLGGALAGERKGAKFGRIFGLPGAAIGSVFGGTAGLLASLAGYEGLITDLNNKGVLYSPTFDEFGDMIGFEEGVNRPSSEELKEYLKKEAQFDLAFGGGLVAARPVLGLFKAGFNKLVGVDPKVYEGLRKIGVDPGRAEVSNIPIINSFPNTFGRIPFFGPAFQKAYKKNAEKFAEKGDKIIPGFRDLTEAAQGGPATILADMGVNVRDAFLKANKKAIEEVVNRYNTVADVGNQMGKAFDIRELRNIAQPLLKKIQAYEDLSPDKTSAAAFKVIREILEPKNAEFAGDFVDYNRFKALRSAIAGSIASMTEAGSKRTWKEGVDDFLALNRTLDKAGGNPIMPAGMNATEFNNLRDSFMKLLKDADENYAQTVTLFGGTLNRNFKGVGDYYIEDQIRLGGDFTNEIFEKAFKINSVEASETLYKIFSKIDGGEQLYADAVAFKVGKSFRDAFVAEGAERFGPRAALEDMGNLRFSTEIFKKKLGLDQITSFDNTSLKGLEHSLKRANLIGEGGKALDVDTLRQFSNATALFFNNKNFNMSTFLARRAQIGGTKSILRAITGGGLVATGGAVTAGVLPTLIGLLAARYSSRLFANPFVIKPFAQAMDDAAKGTFLKDPKRVENVARILKNLFDQDKELFQNIENDFNEIQSRAANSRTFNLGSTFFDNKSNMNNAQFVGNLVNKTKNQVNEVAPNIVPNISPEAESTTTNVNVPTTDQVARNRLPDIDQVINQPLATSAPNPQTAEVLFPQDELLQASLRRRV